MTTEFANKSLVANWGEKERVVVNVGLFSLGISFSIWSVLIAIYLVTGSHFGIYFTTFAVPIPYTIGLTIIGLVAIGFSLKMLPLRERLKATISLIGFVLMNIIGFIYLFPFIFVQQGTVYTLSWSLYAALYQQAAIFLGYVVVFGLLLFPFLKKSIRWTLLIPSLTAVTYLALIIRWNLQFYADSVGVIWPGLTFPPLAQLFSPMFGIPGYQLFNGITNTEPAYSLLFAVASNASYAVLFFLSTRIDIVKN